MRLEGKVAIVSGGAGGMGAEEARLFAREGAAVTITDLLEDEGAKVEAEIAELGGRAMFLRADVTSEEDWRDVVQKTVSRFGKLDVLVNNAGISSGSYADPLDTDGWLHIMDVNSTGTSFYCHVCLDDFTNADHMRGLMLHPTSHRHETAFTKNRRAPGEAARRARTVKAEQEEKDKKEKDKKKEEGKEGKIKFCKNMMIKISKHPPYIVCSALTRKKWRRSACGNCKIIQE